MNCHLFVKSNTNILTSYTRLQRVEGTQALEGIRSNLGDLIVAEVSVIRRKNWVMRQKELKKIKKTDII